uniref:Uncharacterized protein n=1 Tax=Anguilla anguilla TaxID=7936 RepID=A0A0E9T711_ANGAN
MFTKRTFTWGQEMQIKLDFHTLLLLTPLRKVPHLKNEIK